MRTGCPKIHPGDVFVAPPQNDPVLQEVRAIRRQLRETSGRDIRWYIEEPEQPRWRFGLVA